MSQTNDDMLVVLAAGYGSVPAAVDAYDTVRGAYEEHNADGALHCDAAVVDPHQTDLDSRVIRETPRQGQAGGAPVHGLATRLARYLGEGLALVGGPAGGGDEDVLDAADTSETGPLDAADLSKLGAVQETSSAVLIGIFPAAMSEEITTATKAADERASTQLRASAQQLEAQIVRAEQQSMADHQR